MKIYLLAGTIFSACASANGDGSIQGKILVDGVNNDDISVVSCTADSVVVKGNDVTTIEAGKILVHIDGKSIGESICTSCGPLFRKVVSINGDTLTTTFASFAEVFDHDIFEDHGDLNDALIEPQLRCPHSFHDSTEVNMSRRRMEDNKGLQFDTFCNATWGIISYLLFIPVFFSGGLLFDSMDAVRTQFKSLIDVWGKTWNCSVTGNRRTRSLWSENDTKIFVPSNREEWKSRDDEEKCVYFNCNSPIGEADCFDSTDLSCPKKGGSHLLLHTPDFAKSSLDEFILQSASCNHEICYASNIDKDTCDIEFSRYTEKICASSSESVNAMAIVGDVTFPLSSKSINENCSLLSVVFYIGLKVFGNNVRNELQSKQVDYQNTYCVGQM
jgi:hypothetical protein